MNIQVNSCNGISLIPLKTRLLAKRKIFLEGEINEASVCETGQQIMLLAAEDAKTPIDIFINSPGGEINSGLLLYDIIQTCKTPLRLFCFGKAYSMAAVLFASGRFGRFLLPNSELMLHEPLLGNRVSGNSSSIKSIADSLQDTKMKIDTILAKHTGKSISEIAEATSYDHYFQAADCIAYGLGDKIIGFEEMMQEGCI